MLLLVGLSHLVRSRQVLHNLAPPPAQQRQPTWNRCRLSAWPSAQTSPQQEPSALIKPEQSTARLRYHWTVPAVVTLPLCHMAGTSACSSGQTAVLGLT